MLRLTPEQLEQIRDNKNKLYNDTLINFDYFSLRQLQFLGLEADIAPILRSLPAPLTLTNGNIIAKWQIACVPLMREWVLDHIPDSSWRRAYLMILEILSGQVITWTIQAADFPVSGDGTFPKNERYVDEFLSRAAALIMAMSGRIVILPGNTPSGYYSDVVYNDKQFLKAPNEALSLFNCWRLGRQIALFGKPEPEGTTKPRPLSLYRPISEIDSGDIAQMVSAGRRLARSTLLKLPMTQMQYYITILSYNLVIELAQVNDNKLTVAELIDWLRFYRTTALKYLMHLSRDRPYGNVLNVGYRPEQQTLKAEIVKILSSYIRLSNNSAENRLLLESLAGQLLFRIKS